ncbi:PREDICTED: E3 ubiquitin-protein ligase RNF126-A isoform X2 [Eufriesea mexicana]|uniref:E3 ubiquitin-protein ligase RNF126-A isoform X2 n=1 Tax=Eufriesea mexicana TaxID=516756 RepID=UPI00083C5EE9|nr:PREDICTED: E3 ubiquitin-protein ligase RNF126-A isoform X2 [Eufriesea mexicana]
MAEAVVDGAMSRFFCHKCSIEIERLLPDYTCPRCSSGFIEELESDSSDNGSRMDISRDVIDLLERYADVPLRREYEMEFSDQFETPVSSNRNNGTANRRRVHWSRNAPDTLRFNRGRAGQEVMPTTLENIIQDFVLNFSGLAQAAQLPVFNIRLFLGNPGDYVWSQDGLDAIVTQLLNQMDGTGPPPLPRKQIDEIPTITVDQFHVDSKLQCSVCWEDFKLSEPVKQLPCLHLYHAPCIVPWLELHGTCPICRQHLGGQNSAEVHQDTVGRSLVALFRATNESNSTRTSSTSSSSGNNASSNPSSEI